MAIPSSESGSADAVEMAWLGLDERGVDPVDVIEGAPFRSFEELGLGRNVRFANERLSCNA